MASDGSYFQCPHCRTRYAATAKARAADGKRIRCKHCHEPFTLTIVAASRPRTPPPATSAKKAAAKPRPNRVTPKPAAAKAKRGKPRSRFQFGAVILLLALLGYGGWWGNYYFLSTPATVTTEAEQQPRATEKQAKQQPAPAKEEAPLVDPKVVKELTEEAQRPDPSSLNFKASQACRDVAAAQWLNDYTLTHTNFGRTEFVRLLDESVSLTEQIRKKCKNNQLLLSVIESAKAGKKPLWLAPLINALINPEYDSTKVVGDEGF